VSERTTPPLGWWTISGEALLDALRRVAAGESPDLVYAELYANCEQHERFGRDE
jgi:hypothetical protein